jgi:Flp pilus assembly protein TadG
MAFLNRPFRSRSKRQGGASSVEMIVVLPVLLTLTFGICEFGILLWKWQLLQNSVRVGARVASLFRDPCVENAVKTEATDAAKKAIDGVQYDGAPTIKVDGDICARGLVTVSATAKYRFLVLQVFIPSMTEISLPAKAVMRNEI